MLVLQVYLHILLCKTVTSFYISQLFLVQKIAVNNLLPKILLPFYPPVKEWEVPQFSLFSLLINRNHWNQWREMLQKLSNIFLLSMTFLNMNLRKSLSKLFFPPRFPPQVFRVRLYCSAGLQQLLTPWSRAGVTARTGWSWVFWGTDVAKHSPAHEHFACSVCWKVFLL